jgi:hypothetical protein
MRSASLPVNLYPYSVFDQPASAKVGGKILCPPLRAAARVRYARAKSMRGPCIRAHCGRRIFSAAAPCRRGCGSGAVPAVPVGRSRRPFRRFPAAVGGGLGCWGFVSFSEVFMRSGFVSVPSRRGAGIIARPLRGGWVWSRRALPAAPGWSPAPACLFVPFASLASAAAVGRVLSSYGLRVWVRSGSAGSPVFAACGLPVPAFVVKVAVPAGRCSAWLVSFVQSVCSAGVVVPAPARRAALSSLAFAL